MAMDAMKVFDVSVVAVGDPAPVLEAAELALDDVALLVDCVISVEQDFAVFLGRDDGIVAARGEP